MDDIRIDFTEGRVFSKNRLTGIELDFWKAAKLDFPWTWTMMQKIESDADLDDEPSKTLFFTGTNHQIKYKWEYAQMEKGEMCECCGSEIIKFPWDDFKKYPFLCDRCASNMNKEYGRDLFGMPKKKDLPEEHWWLVL